MVANFNTDSISVEGLNQNASKKLDTTNSSIDTGKNTNRSESFISWNGSEVSNLLTYWVSTIDGLPSCFIPMQNIGELRELSEHPTGKLSGTHVIIADPDAREIDIKRIGWLADDCKVFVSGNTHIAQLWNSYKAFTVFSEDLNPIGMRDFDDWVTELHKPREENKCYELDPSDALDIAELAINLKPKNYTAELEILRQRSGYSSYDWNRVTSETELIDDADDEYIKEYLDKVLNEVVPDLDPRQFLPEHIAKALISFGSNQSLPQASLMLTFISVVSALHKVGTKVAIAPSTLDFKQNPAINHAILGKSGNGKSIITANLIDTPLKALRQADKARFKNDSAEYQKALQAWEKSDKSTLQPEPPKPVNKMFLTGWTIEGLKAYLNNAPSYSVLNCVDELAGLFEGFNQYKRGKGNDRQEFLSLYDGRGVSEAKVTNPIEIDDSNVAVIGGLQPVKLRKYFQLGDSDGLLPRFTFSTLPDVPRYLPIEHGKKVDIQPLLASIYDAVLNEESATYEITGESYEYFRTVDIKWQREAHTLPDGARKEFLKKCKGLLARLALNLHIVHELSRTDSFYVDKNIPLERIKQAAAIIDFNLKQLEYVHRELEDNAVTDIIEMIVKLSQKRQSVGDDGWLTAREISQGQNPNKRMKTAEIRDMMVKATELGYGQTRGTSSRLEFLATVDNCRQSVDNCRLPSVDNSNPYTVGNSEILNQSTVDNCRQSVDNCRLPKTVDTSELQPLEDETVDNVDNFSDFSDSDDLVFPVNLSTVSTPGNENAEIPTPQSLEANSPESTPSLQKSTLPNSKVPETFTQQGVDSDSKEIYSPIYNSDEVLSDEDIDL